MKMINSLKNLLAEAKLKDSYWVEKAKLDFSVALEQRRRQKGMSYKDIGEKMGTSQPYITKVFRGDANFTIETMVKLARATGGQLELHIVDAQAAALEQSVREMGHEAAVAVRQWNMRAVLPPGKAHPTGASETVIEVDFAANGRYWPDARLAAAA